MRIAYLYNRDQSDADGLDADHVYSDWPRDNRYDRQVLLSDAGLRPGDVLLLRAKGDLGHAAEAAAIARLIEARGVTIEIVPLPRKTVKRGRGKAMVLTDEQRRDMCAQWRSGAPQKVALARMSQIAGRTVTRAQAYRVCGARFEKT